jgi:negative regulator of sigma E activity
MRFRPVFLCLLATACLANTTPVRGVDPDVTYQKIMEAPARVSYRATMTKQRFNAAGDTTRYVQKITHQRPDRDRIDIPDSEGRIREVIIRVDDDIYRRKAEGDSLFYSHRRQSNSNVLDMNLEFSSLDLLQTNYELEITGGDRLLDRPVAVLAFKPRHPGRMTMTAWIDEETGLVMRTEERNEAGVLVEELFLTEFEKDPLIPPKTFATEEWAGKSVEINQVIACGSISEVQQEADFKLNAPVYIPSGFTLQQRRVIQHHGQPLVHFMYSDGLSRISLFQRIASSETSHRSPRGTPELHGDVRVWERGPYSILRRYYDGKLFTVIGDVAVSESVELLTSLCTIKPAVTASPSPQGYSSWIGAGVGVLAVGLWILWRRRA